MDALMRSSLCSGRVPIGTMVLRGFKRSWAGKNVYLEHKNAYLETKMRYLEPITCYQDLDEILN